MLVLVLLLLLLLLVLVLVLGRVLLLLRRHLLLRDMVLLQCLMLVRVSRAIITRPLATSRLHAPFSAVCAPKKLNLFFISVGTLIAHGVWNSKTFDVQG